MASSQTALCSALAPRQLMSPSAVGLSLDLGSVSAHSPAPTDCQIIQSDRIIQSMQFTVSVRALAMSSASDPIRGCSAGDCAVQNRPYSVLVGTDAPCQIKIGHAPRRLPLSHPGVLRHLLHPPARLHVPPINRLGSGSLPSGKGGLAQCS